jgi:hypothetical protein
MASNIRLCRERPKLNVLVAYPYFTKAIEDVIKSQNREKYRLIVDSGAFTAWNTGRTINLDDYCRFLDSISYLQPFYAVQLDVFGNKKQTKKNYEIMRSRGYHVMPVFTRGEDKGQLESLYEDTDYIMFGGVTVGRGNKEYVKWFVENNKNRKAHWLGFVNMPFIKRYKPESVDSSSVTSCAQYGNFSLYKGGGMLTTVKKSEFIKKPCVEMQSMFSRVGIKPSEIKILSYAQSWVGQRIFEDFSIEHKDKRGAANFISQLSHILRSVQVEKKLGTKIYIAVATPIALKCIFKGYEFLEERGKI